MEKSSSPSIFKFPPLEQANPDGLLAIGGDLSAETLLLAYQSGIFPWYSKKPILWWSPDPRFVLFPEDLKVSHSMEKELKKKTFEVTIDQDFEGVIKKCSSVMRKNQQGTWITWEMQQAYIRLNQMGFAHSVESWENNTLVGGLYGVRLGKIFFGESMFSEKNNASKVALITYVRQLRQEGCLLIDCQVFTSHMESMGAKNISRKKFMEWIITSR
ncbi:MAG: leucyl/phenylalanyl-tRNA--protein transferase [Chitinophagaceae bacterium]